MSSIIACCGLKDNLHTKEAEAFLRAQETFKNNLDFFVKAVEHTGSEDLELALGYLYQSYQSVVKELKDSDAKNIIDNPLYKIVYTSLSDKENEDAFKLFCIRLAVMQDELSRDKQNGLTE